MSEKNLLTYVNLKFDLIAIDFGIVVIYKIPIFWRGLLNKKIG